MQRKFNVADSVFLEFASTTLLNLNEDLESFESFNKQLNAAKKEVLRTAIQDAYNV